MKFLRVSQLLLCSILFICFLGRVKAQTQPEAGVQASNTTTDPTEAKALNAVFQKWGISADKSKWNITGDLCTAAALGDSPTIDAVNINPFIKCDCTFENSTVCRIIALKVYSNDVSGSIPDELWTLTYLQNLNLGLNILTGNLSSSIGNLTRMQYLSFGVNSLSGKLPEELGLLTDLRSLGLGGNNFSGPLPSSLGNLKKLEQLYIDTSGVSGEIPSTFSKLTNLKILWASGNDFTGRIPSFIGNWPNMTVLRFEGNSFEGPIPSALSKLTSLSDLRISDLTNGSSSLEFIKNMTFLSRLVLRDAKISGTMPDYIGSFANLLLLDLSFNNITGQIPESLFLSANLSQLFLGNNQLNGSLPSQKRSILNTIDVSYNNLGGSLPSWATNEKNLEFNGVANNFTIEQSKNSVLPSGLQCLQNGFPCNRKPPIYSQFAVKCGGPPIKSASGVEYEREDEALGPASYYVANDERWGVSNVGYFADNPNSQYIIPSQSQFSGTLDSEIFQSARISASSLRYYGLGLQNGNYSVKLQFVELSISNGRTWKSLGRRIFDIYIQGNRVAKDFDVREEAGGVSSQPVVRSFNTSVGENYMEIHLRWAGKGTCCIPNQGTYGPIISAISVTPDFVPTVKNTRPSSKLPMRVLVGVVVAVGLIFVALMWCVSIAVRRRRMHPKDEELRGIDNMPHLFTYSELRTATEGFHLKNKLGEGGFGPVYKGKLCDGREVAVKQLELESRQGKKQFAAEIATISAVQHRNLVALHGCCIEGNNRLLVYEYLENKSIDQALYGGGSLDLDWEKRYDICLGIAKGLAYLHEESRLKIVHRDVKASNILLDSELVPKISDFGLARLYDVKKTHISTHVAGTFGYLAPEYAMRGELTEKVDVFAFGVVLLEIISGRPNQDPRQAGEKKYLLAWAWTLHESGQELDLVDGRLAAYDPAEVKRLVDVSLQCTQTSRLQRPSMSRVVAMISGDAEVEIVASRPGYLDDCKAEDGDSFQVYTSGTSEAIHFDFSGSATVSDHSRV